MMFVTIFRIMGNTSGAHTVHTLLNETTAHPEFFSISARRARALVRKGVQWTSDMLAEFDKNNSWEPTADLLRKKDLSSHKTKFNAIYAPIRHHVAHIIFKDETEIQKLFGMTLKTDIDEILCFLHGLVGAIRFMADNGQPPDIKKDNYGFGSKANRIMRETEEMLRAQP